MPRLSTYLKTQTRRLVMARVGRNGIDLTQLDRVPDRLTWPLDRDGATRCRGSASCASRTRSPS